MARSSAALIVAIVMLALIAAGAALLAVKRSGVGGTGLGILTHGFPQSSSSGGLLTEEIAPELVVTNHTITLEQGKVYELEYGPSGYVFQEKSGYKIIERVNLTNVDVSVNDVVAPHLYDWYFDGRDDRVVFSASSVYYLDTMTVVVRSEFNYIDADWGFRPEIAGTWAWLGYNTNWMLYRNFNWGPNGLSWVMYFNYDGGEGIVMLWYTGLDIGSVYTYAVSRSSTGVVKYWIDGVGRNKVNVRYNGTWYSVNSYEVDLRQYGFQGWNQTADRPLTSGLMLRGRLSYIAITSNFASDTDISEIMRGIVRNPAFLADATFFNGTHYFDLVNNVVGTPYGGVARVPAQQTWLWLIKSLTNDNQLHLKFVPAGSVFRIYYNGIVREYYVPETCSNAVGLCEDYTIDLASDFGVTTLVGADIELIYPSPKVRVYAPSGFIVKVVDSAGATWAEVEVASNYVDLPIPSGQYTIMLIAKQRSSDVYIDFQKTPSRLVMTVTDIYGTPIGNALIIVRDTATKTIIYKTVANEAGQAEVPMNVLANYRYLTVEVKALYNGIIYETAVDYDLRADQVKTITPQPVVTKPQSAGLGLSTATKLVLLGVGIVALLAVVMALMARRR